MTRLKVLHVINGLGPGGAETLLYRLATLPSEIDHEVICFAGRDWYSRLLEDRGIAVYHLDATTPWSLPASIVRLNSLVRQSSADVVQTWLYRSNMLGGIVARLAGIPVVWSIHCSSLKPLGLASRALVYLSGVLARWVPDFIVNCSARSAELHARLGYVHSEGDVISNGYDPGAFFPDAGVRNRMRRSLGIPSDTFLIGSIARWNPYKDIPTLLSAISLVSRANIPVRCLLIGDGLDQTNADLMTAIEKAKCGSVLLPLGRRRDIQDLARAMDIHVLSSVSEAFPNVVAETMLSGVPNVVTNVGDTALMVGSTGWLVPPQDPRALADGIVEAYRESRNKPTEWRFRRDSSRNQIAARFSLERMASAYQAIWARLAETKLPALPVGN